MNYLPHEQRVIDESKALDEKRVKLVYFLNSPNFHALNRIERDLLNRQYDAMNNYQKILLERIDHFSRKYR